MVLLLLLGLGVSTPSGRQKVIVNLRNDATMRCQLQCTDEHAAKGGDRIIVVTQEVNVDVEQLLKQGKAYIVN